MRKPKIYLRLSALALAAALVALDQWCKGLAEKSLRPDGEMILIPRVLGLLYTENTGISFSLFEESKAAMTVITIVTGIVLLGVLRALLWGKFPGGMGCWSAALILAGGLGNWIDRVAQGYVIDYFEFLFVRFAIFNLADVYITCGVIWLAALMLYGEVRGRKTAVTP